MTIRIGFIGAGNICRHRHLPGLSRIDSAQAVAVSNRSLESSQKVCDEFDIPDAMDDWHALLDRNDIDAAFIGTWPYLHREATIEALEKGKHVFVQARMSTDLENARAMLEAAKAHPKQVTMICPPPHRMPWEATIKRLLAPDNDAGVGELREVVVQCRNGGALKSDTISWRERVEHSGKQIMGVGIWAETLNAWVGPYRTLTANLATPIPTKKDEQGNEVPVRIPQICAVQGVLASGTPITETHTGVDPQANINQARFVGSRGTLVVDISNKLTFAKHGQPFEPVTPPDHELRPWQVEQDFINAVHAANAGENWHVDPDFEVGLLYMKKMEAVHLAAETGKAVNPDEL